MYPVYKLDPQIIIIHLLKHIMMYIHNKRLEEIYY